MYLHICAKYVVTAVNMQQRAQFTYITEQLWLSCYFTITWNTM